MARGTTDLSEVDFGIRAHARLADEVHNPLLALIA